MERTGYRADIDGLRAVAVLAVIGFHAFPGSVRGGFVGVDVFFVVSGFLITRIILGRLEEGAFDFREFYGRRIRRIFPALIVVLAAACALGGFLLLADEYRQLGKHVAGGAGFVSNFVLWREAGYFDNSADTKPLLHLWSLGVEEQFYIAWPLVLWVVFRGFSRPLPAVLALLVASFALNIALLRGDPVGTFYSPATRGWQLLAGATLASAAARGLVAASPVSGLRADLQALLGIVMIAGSIMFLSPQLRYPGGWALVPTIGTCLVIAAGPSATLNRRLLTHPTLVWLGLVSYPLYLWHWPLLSFARIVESETPVHGIRLAAVALSLALAWLTYRFIERPVRAEGRHSLKVVCLAGLMFTVGLGGGVIYATDGFASRASQESFDPRTHAFPDSPGCIARHPYAAGASCHESGGTAARTTLLIGDSHLEALARGLASVHAAGHAGMKLLVLAKGGCPPFYDTELIQDSGEAHGCRTVMNGALDYALESRDVESVVLVGRHAWRVSLAGFGEIEKDPRPHTLHYVYDDGTVRATSSEEVFERGLRKTLDRLTAAGKRVLFVDQVPELGFDPKACVRPSLTAWLAGTDARGRCTVSVREVIARQATYRRIAGGVLVGYPRVERLDALSLFCGPATCSPMPEGKMLYRDDDHLGIAGARLLGVRILAATSPPGR